MPDPLIPLLAFAAGCLFGSWLYYKGRTGNSPLPRVLPDKKEPPEPGPYKYPQVKP